MGVLQVTVNAVDVTANVFWDESEFAQMADEGAVGQGTLHLRDVPGTFTPRFNQVVLLKEDGVTKWKGIVGADVKSRDEVVDHIGVRRVVSFDLLDENNLFDRVLVDNWKRSGETDVARVTAAFAAFRSAVDRVTFVPATATVAMDANTYTDNALRDVTADGAATAGKNYWIDENDKLHYAVDGSLSSNLSTIRLTDVYQTSINSNVYVGNIYTSGASNFNIGLIQENEDPFSIPIQTRLRLKWGAKTPPAYVDVNDLTAESTYGRVEGPPVYDTRSKTSTNATNRANALLAKMSTPEKGWSTTIGLPTWSISAGQYLSLYSQPLGLNQNERIVQLTGRRKGDAAAGYWQFDLEFRAPQRKAPRAKGYDGPRQDGAPDLTPGSAMSLSYYERNISDSPTDTGWYPIGQPTVGTWLAFNDPFPVTPCGFASLGAWRIQARQYGALSATAPADNNYMAVRMVVTYANLAHGPAGYFTGSADAIHGPILITSGIRGATPQNSDIDASGNSAAGITVGSWGQGQSGGVTATFDINRNSIPWGSAFRMLFTPGWFLTGSYVCVETEINNNIVQCGSVRINSVTLTPYTLTDGSFGWFTGGVAGVQDGNNTTFTLPNGYTVVRRVWRNGVDVGDAGWTATDGSTITTLGWAPTATDTILVERYVPR